jgi:hypothetical protein
MNKDYYFRWKKKYFWHKEKVVGHKYEEEQNKMLLYLDNGGLREVAHWDQCECKLGIDWVLAVKDQIKEEAGQ